MKFIVACIPLLTFFTNLHSQVKPPAVRLAIGSVYHNIDELPFFRGYKERTGRMLEPTDANYAVSIVGRRNDQYLILDTCLISNNYVRYKILDIVKISNVPASQDILTSGCRLNKKGDSNIIAIVMFGDQEYTKNIIRAWKINRSAHHLQAISLKDIDCVNEGFYL